MLWYRHTLPLRLYVLGLTESCERVVGMHGVVHWLQWCAFSHMDAHTLTASWCIVQWVLACCCAAPVVLLRCHITCSQSGCLMLMWHVLVWVRVMRPSRGLSLLGPLILRTVASSFCRFNKLLSCVLAW